MTLRVEEYVRQDGSVPFKDWFERLDPHAAAKVATAVTRLFYGGTKKRQQIASAVLLAVTAVASYLPARRAARVDPVTVLRAE